MEFEQQCRLVPPQHFCPHSFSSGAQVDFDANNSLDELDLDNSLVELNLDNSLVELDLGSRHTSGEAAQYLPSGQQYQLATIQHPVGHSVSSAQ